MINRLREEDSDDVDELPDSVHAVIAARLDVLGADERRLLQSASVIGQRFWEQTVGELTGESSVGESLAALVDKDLLTPSSATGLAGEREFAFKHALVRDVAYSTLPRAVRAKRHYEVAQIIEGREATSRESVAALLAEHYGRAAALAEQADFPGDELDQMRIRAARAFASPPTSRRRSIRTRRHSSTTRMRCASERGSKRRRWPGSRRAVATPPSVPATSTPRSRPGPAPRPRMTAAALRREPVSCTARSGRGSGRRAIANLRSPTSSRGSTCSRTASRAAS